MATTGNHKPNIFTTLLMIALLLAFCIAVFQCQSNKETANRSELNSKIDKDSISYYKNKIGTLTASVGTYQVTAGEFKEKFLQSDEQLKKVTASFSKLQQVVKYTAKARIDTIRIPFDQPIVYDTISKKEIPSFLRESSKVQDWVSFDWKVDNYGLTVSNLTGSIELTTVIGFKRKWFLGQQYATTEITPSAKNVTVVNLKSEEIVVPKKFYQTNAFLIGTGFLIRSLIPTNIHL